MTDFSQDMIATAIRGLGVKIASLLLGLLAMLIFVALGLVLGALTRAILTRLARAFDLDTRAHSSRLASGLARAGVRRSPSDVVGAIGFWAVLGFFATMGFDALGIAGSRATEAVTLLIPRLLVGVLIFAAGWLAANFVGQALLISAVNAGVPEARLLGRAARWGVLLFASATMLTHVGIGKDTVMVAFAITFGGLVFSLALAFGLGGRTLAREILERRLRREQQPSHETITHL